MASNQYPNNHLSHTDESMYNMFVCLFVTMWRILLNRYGHMLAQSNHKKSEAKQNTFRVFAFPFGTR